MIPDEGLVSLLRGKLLGLDANTLRVRIFKNNYTPVALSVVGDFTEADYSGYASQTPVFPVPGVSGNVSSSTAAMLTFLRGVGATSNDCYGWYATATFGGVTKLVDAKRFAVTPKSMAVVGDGINVTWTITDQAA